MRYSDATSFALSVGGNVRRDSASQVSTASMTTASSDSFTPSR